MVRYGFISLCVLFTVIFSIGLVSGDNSIQFHDFDKDEIVGESVIQNEYPDPSYVFEGFDNQRSTYISYNNFNTAKTTTSYTTDPTESFDGSALYQNQVDGQNYDSLQHLEMYIGKNDSSFAGLRTFEFDFMFEAGPSTQGFALVLFSLDYSLARYYLNTSCDKVSPNTNTEGHTNWIEEKRVRSEEIDFGYQIAPAEWHHVIISIHNNMVDGRVLTIHLDNVTMRWNTTYDGSLPSSLNWKLVPKPEEKYGSPLSGSFGRDWVIDNLAMYNTSYDTDDIIDALGITDDDDGPVVVYTARQTPSLNEIIQTWFPIFLIVIILIGLKSSGTTA